MHAKWLDVGSTMAAFHMQSKRFDAIRPPSFGDHQHADEEPKAEKEPELTEADTFNSEESVQSTRNGTSNHGKVLNPKDGKGPQAPEVELVKSIQAPSPRGLPFPRYGTRTYGKCESRDTVATVATSGSTRHGSLHGSTTIGRDKNTAPSPFLAEGAHLASLLSAVALSTLRSEADGMDAPMVEFVPGRRWPEYDSERDPDAGKYGRGSNGVGRNVRYMLDLSRTRHNRSAYNAAR